MQLNKFGAILTFAIELEQDAADFYQQAANAYPSRGFEEYAAAAEKRLSRLRRMRRELVNEMLLEPIDGFDRPALPALGTDSMNLKEIQEHKARFEQTREQFYATASVRIATVAPAVSRAFGKMARKS